MADFIIWFFFSVPVIMVVVSSFYYYYKYKGFAKKLNFPVDFSQKESNLNSIEKYIKYRVDPTIKCYNGKAIFSSILFTCLAIIQIVYSALVPVSLMITTKDANSKLIGAAFGAFVTIASGVSVFCKFKEKWLQHLELRDKLFSKRNRFLIRVSRGGELDYDRAQDFIGDCEEIISLEHKNLAAALSKIDDDFDARKTEKEDGLITIT